MALINEEVAQQLKQEFESLKDPVRLAVFSQTIADPGSEQVKRLVEELAGLDNRLTTESYNYVTDTEKVTALGIQRTPAIAVVSQDKDYGVRLYGMPSGYEFGSLIDAILMVSRAESGLSEETRTALSAIDKPVHVQVFSTPT